MNQLLLPLSLVVAWVVWTVVCILRNLATARHIGFPVIISPVHPLNPFWIIFTRLAPSILNVVRGLPFGLGAWARCTYMGWSFDDKHALHDAYGSIFTVVTPGGNEVTVADPGAAHAIFAKRKEFIKPAVMYDQLNVFGRNLNTVEGKDWERQRRLTAPSFNEKTSAVVWEESLQQTHDMVSAWAHEGTKGTFETVADTATLALHVLTRVGFGIEYPFSGGVRELSKGHVMTYRDALSLCLQNIITFAIFPKKFLSFSFLPQKLRTLGIAVQEFQKYMEEMLSHERETAEKHSSSQYNLMSTFVRASDESKEYGEENKGHISSRLTNEEIFGNIFAFNLAGHETTANTVATALVLLASHPKYQDWIVEEINRVFRNGTSYESAFPSLKRCLAVMYETLRLYGSINFIPKTTGFHTQLISSRGKDHVLPPHTAVNINIQALQTDPTTWGPDALDWKPDRWLHQSSPSTQEDFIEPEKGSYAPWADGPRACIGKKFSQVEFVGVLATLFAQYRARPAGADQSAGRQKLTGMINDMGIMYITNQMRRPKEVALVWEKR